ncbi:EAL domain-containing protein [Hyphomicrobium sp.]|uniref:EAL domain-containing protein n=1 Tax=Hyphomicrobium sp. TaxID=82 RepID=UPI0025B9F828|nr:EAL domain-containing protein [Hyphomicrobium sp.]
MAFDLDGLAYSAPNTKNGRKKKTTSPYFSTNSDAKAFASAVDQLGIVSITDPKGRIIHANAEFLRVSGYTAEEVAGKDHSILNSGHHPKEFWTHAYEKLHRGETWRAPVKNRAKDGTFYWVDSIIVPLKDRNRQSKGFLSFQIDITTAVTLHMALQDRNSLLQAVVDSFPGGLTVFDRDLRLLLCNRKQRQLLDYPDSLFENSLPTLEDLYRFNANRGEYGPGNIEEQVRTRLELARKGEAHTFERQRPNGTYLEIRGTPLPGGGYVTTHLDVTERKRYQETIGRLAHQDVLTGLPNRALFQERIRQGLKQVQNGASLALHCLDLDRFKSVNDTLGHPIGDSLLVAVAERLRAEIRETDTVARLGGDEFAIIQVAPRSIEEIEALARRIIGAFSEPFVLEENTVSIRTSIGISVAPSDGVDAEQLMMNADMALYRTKSLGRGTFGFYEQSMHERLQSRHQIIMGLREAIANSKFELHYQPIVNVKTRKIVGCEALIRWSHPIRGLIPAHEFIPIAEECGLIGQIGDWVLKTACAEASLWPDDIWVAVNISPAQFRGRDLIEKVTNACRALPLSRLILEITETLLMKDRDIASDTLERLRKMGVRFAIDDFGTGFSSLSYLQSFPFDKIKIDRSFVSDVANLKRSATLRRSIIQLGYNLGMTSVGEGVETEQQLDRLRAEGCVEAQGFLFSRAVPAAKLRTLFSKPL